MDLIPSGAQYALLLLFGGVAVAVHATALYAVPLPRPDQERVSPMLERVALASIGGPKSYGKGLLCYLAITEFLYLVLSFSSVILDLSLSAMGGEGSVGALTPNSADINPLTPILASSVIMTVGQFRPFAQVENAIRRLSHHVAGIPHGVYEALDRIQTFGLDPESPPVSTSAQERAESEGSTASDESASGNGQGSRRGPADKARRSSTTLPERASLAALAAGMEDDAAVWFADDLLRIHRLRLYTYGRDGERSWSQQSFAALAGPLEIVVPRQAALQQSVKALLADESATESAAGSAERLQAWRTVAREAVEVRKDLALLFALLTINQSVLRVPDDAPEMRTMVAHVARQPTGQDFNLLIGATLVGLVLAMLALLTYHVSISPVGDLFHHLFDHGEAPDTVPGELESWSQYLFGEVQGSLRVSLRDTLDFGLIFFVAAAVGLSLRSSRIASLEWTFWRDGAYPFRQYLSVGIMAMLIAFLFYTLASFWSLVVRPSLGVQGGLPPPSLLRDFMAQYADYVLVPLIGLLCAWYVCLIADRRTPTRTRPNVRPGADPVVADRSGHLSDGRLAISFAAGCGLVNTLIRIENGSIASVGTALDALLVPGAILGCCFYLYALLQRKLGRGQRRHAGRPVAAFS